MGNNLIEKGYGVYEMFLDFCQTIMLVINVCQTITNYNCQTQPQCKNRFIGWPTSSGRFYQAADFYQILPLVTFRKNKNIMCNKLIFWFSSYLAFYVILFFRLFVFLFNWLNTEFKLYFAKLF